MAIDLFLLAVLKIVGAVGGVAAVSGAVSAWTSQHLSARWLQAHKAELDKQLETHKAELSNATETYKLTLKRQELLFRREVEAADAFIALRRSIWPLYEHPDMDWHDACAALAPRLATVERELDAFLASHAAVMGKSAREKVERAKVEAAHEKFVTLDGPDDEPTTTAIKAAGSVMEALLEAEEQIYSDLRR